MEIRPLNNRTVKVTMSAAEMEKCSLTYRDLALRTSCAESFLAGLVTLLREYDGTGLDSEKTYVEIFGEKGGGCTIFLSAIPDKNIAVIRKTARESGGEIVTFEEKTPTDLLHLSRKIGKRYQNIIEKSSLYFANNRYRLIVCAKNEIPKALGVCQKGEFAAAVTCEHWRCLLESDALTRLGELYHE